MSVLDPDFQVPERKGLVVFHGVLEVTLKRGFRTLDTKSLIPSIEITKMENKDCPGNGYLHYFLAQLEAWALKEHAMVVVDNVPSDHRLVDYLKGWRREYRLYPNGLGNRSNLTFYKRF